MDFKHHLDEYMKVIETKTKNEKQLKLCKQYIPDLEKILYLSFIQENINLTDPNIKKIMDKIKKKLEKKLNRK